MLSPNDLKSFIIPVAKMRTLEKLTIKNFKSIREQTLALGRLNVFIGGNGVGKFSSGIPGDFAAGRPA